MRVTVFLQVTSRASCKGYPAYELDSQYVIPMNAIILKLCCQYLPSWLLVGPVTRYHHDLL